MKFLFPLILVSASLLSCSGPKIPDGRIMVQNDSQDSEYNQIVVSGSGPRVTLKPGEHTILPKSTRMFNVSRRYKDFTRYYGVQCPPIKGKGIRIKLIDIHVNRIAGGCTRTDASKG